MQNRATRRKRYRKPLRLIVVDFLIQSALLQWTAWIVLAALVIAGEYNR
jgi:hypothetical protein